MKKGTFEHWTKFLSEAGTIIHQGDAQERRLRQISELRKEIRDLQAEYHKEEVSITSLATQPDYWTVEEVEQAKRLSKQYLSLNAYQEHLYKDHRTNH